MSIPETLASMDTFLSFALVVAIKATILLTLAFIASFALRRTSAALRHLVWALAIGAIVALPLIVAVTPALPLLPAPAPVVRTADNDHSVVTTSERSAKGDEPLSSESNTAATTPM